MDSQPASQATTPARAESTSREVSPSLAGVSLRFLKEFYSTHVEPEDKRRSQPLTTSEVIQTFVVPHTKAENCSYVRLFTFRESDLWPGPISGSDMRFVSHAWGNPFRLLVTSICKHLEDAGGAQTSTFVWLVRWKCHLQLCCDKSVSQSPPPLVIHRRPLWSFTGPFCAEPECARPGVGRGQNPNVIPECVC